MPEDPAPLLQRRAALLGEVARIDAELDGTSAQQDTYVIRGYGVVEKRILPGNKSSGRLNLPIGRVGQLVKVVYLEPEPREDVP